MGVRNNLSEQEKIEHKNRINNAYYHRNKERINFKRRGGEKKPLLTDEERRIKTKEYNDKVREEMKRQPHKVYLLEDYNYVGTTQWLGKRFSQHKYKSGYDCKNYKILFEGTREECLELEKTYHEKGYNGGNSKFASYR